MAKRKSISKKLRFEVFKRDKFACQYCGGKAPDVVLNVDHIEPVAKGGGNDLFNLITSCFECNQGKKARRLDDNEELNRQRDELAIIQEKRNQLAMLKRWRDECSKLEIETLLLAEELVGAELGCELSDAGKTNMRRHIRKYGINEVLEAIRIASERYSEPEEALDKVPGICSNREKERKRPGTGRAFYVRGILNRRFHYINEQYFWVLINEAIDNSVDMESVVRIAKECYSWPDFQKSMEDYNEEYRNG